MNSDERFGTIVPEAIDEKIQRVVSQLQECLPYREWEHPENIGLLDIAIDMGAELLRYASVIKAYLVHGEREYNRVRQCSGSTSMIKDLREAMKDHHSMASVLDGYITAEVRGMEFLEKFIEDCAAKRHDGEKSD